MIPNQTIAKKEKIHYFMPQYYVNGINRKQYEEDLKQRQKQHLDFIQQIQDQNWQPSY